MTSDIEWEKWGSRDPYYGVITVPKFRTANLTPQARQEFFDSGRHHLQHVLATCRRHFDPAFAPRRALDFGCGVGRVVVPLAEMAEWVVGVDVSPSMLAEARRNCAALGLHHVDLLISDDELSMLDKPFDFIHSSIVLQHVDIPRGRRLFKRLVELLAPSGLGAIHVTYGKAYFPDSFGQPPPPLPVEHTWLQSLNPLRLGRRQAGIQPAAPAAQDDPEMLMHVYSLSELAFILQRAGVARFCADFTDHGGELGALLYFQRAAS